MRSKTLVLLFIAGFSFLTSAAFGQSVRQLSEGRFFSVYAPRDIDIPDLIKQLNFEYLTHVKGFSADSSSDMVHLLNTTLDSLYLEVSDILDIHVYSFHGKIKFVPDQRAVAAAYRDFSGQAFQERSFYLHQESTIYISLEDITLGMLGHEMAHAIISHYFVIPPPIKTQEVLSGYVEYSLRKLTGTLP
ncbi:hypothetical protein ACFL5X_03865 [Candidatus Omnitrophota bacterium]